VAKRPKYRRVLLKLSGEAFGAPGGGVDLGQVQHVARQVVSVHRAGVRLGIVIGGGNIVRGRMLSDTGVDPVAADMMGMLATVINGLALQGVLESQGIDARVLSAIPMQVVAEPYVRGRCLKHLEKKRVVILAGGTGNPHFTTDTAAALRARQIGADVLLKATNVDGVYSADPRKNARAKRFRRMTYEQVLHNELGVMDATAVTLCREGKTPIIVFNLSRPNSIRKAVFGLSVGTTIGET